MDCLSRRKFLNLTALGLMPLGIGHLALSACSEARVLEVYKSPSCGCCGKWVDHMRNAGFQVVVTDITDLRPIKNKFGVVPELRACHSAVIDGYVIEGHVPSREVMRLLKDRPKAIGLAVPGMPRSASLSRRRAGSVCAGTSELPYGGILEEAPC